MNFKSFSIKLAKITYRLATLSNYPKVFALLSVRRSKVFLEICQFYRNGRLWYTLRLTYIDPTTAKYFHTYLRYHLEYTHRVKPTNKIRTTRYVATFVAFVRSTFNTHQVKLPLSTTQPPSHTRLLIIIMTRTPNSESFQFVDRDDSHNKEP